MSVFHSPAGTGQVTPSITLLDEDSGSLSRNVRFLEKQIRESLIVDLLTSRKSVTHPLSRMTLNNSTMTKENPSILENLLIRKMSRVLVEVNRDT